MAHWVLKTEGRAEIVEKKSRFIGIARDCASLADFQTQQSSLRKTFPDASHIAFAYRIREAGTLLTRSSDDGEVSGTAGRPIFQHIEGRELINTSVFVVRYYGGINLGTGGLVRAYGNTAKAALAAASRQLFVELRHLTIDVPFAEQNRVENAVQRHGGRVLSRLFSETVMLEIEIAVSEIETVLAEARIALPSGEKAAPDLK